MIFDIEENQPITPEFLKERGYNKINWGSPDYYVDLEKRSHRRQTRPRWGEQSCAWEKYVVRDSVHSINSTLRITYFPESFRKYVSNRQDAKSSVMIDSDDLLTWVDNVHTVQDIIAAEIIAYENQ